MRFPSANLALSSSKKQLKIADGASTMQGSARNTRLLLHIISADVLFIVLAVCHTRGQINPIPFNRTSPTRD
jgi:hypothetical protein